jgi:hypothetical protein
MKHRSSCAWRRFHVGRQFWPRPDGLAKLARQHKETITAEAPEGVADLQDPQLTVGMKEVR